MKLCSACRRHVRPGDGTCPFCGEPLPTTGPVTLGALVLIGALGAACSDRPLEDSATGASTGSSTGTTTGTTATGTTTTTTTPDPTTTAPSSTTSTGTTAVTSTGELSTSDDLDTNDPGCNFYGGACFDFLGLECDPIAQDCAPGEKCTPYTVNVGPDQDAYKCVPVAPDPGQHGEPCTVDGDLGSGLDTCDLGHVCWDIDPDTLTGHCVRLCTGSWDDLTCEPPMTTCAYPANNALLLCLPTCHPLVQDCPTDASCVPTTPDEFVCIPDASGAEGQEFDECLMQGACDPGLFCGDPDLADECVPGAIGCCVSFCDLDAPSCDGQGAACLPWFEMAPPGFENLGYCGLP